jgi:hypothetical protein
MNVNLNLSAEDTQALYKAITLTIVDNKSGTSQPKVAKKLAHLKQFRDRMHSKNADIIDKSDWTAILFALNYSRRFYSHNINMCELHDVDQDNSDYIELVNDFNRLTNLLQHLSESVASAEN